MSDAVVEKMSDETAGTAWLASPKLQGLVGIVTMVGVGFGAAALVGSACQFQAQVKLSREIAANASWEGYMELAFDHPRLADVQDVNALSAEDKIKYPWFVERMLFASEQILTYSPNDILWKETIRGEIQRHPSFMLSKDFVENSFCEYIPELRRVIVDTVEPAKRQLLLCRD